MWSSKIIRIVFGVGMVFIAMTRTGHCQAPILAPPYEDTVSSPVSGPVGRDMQNGGKGPGFGAYDPSIKPLYSNPDTLPILPGLSPGAVGAAPPFVPKTPALMTGSLPQTKDLLSSRPASSWGASTVSSSEQPAYAAGPLQFSGSTLASPSSWVAGRSAFTPGMPATGMNNLLNKGNARSLTQLLSSGNHLANETQVTSGYSSSVGELPKQLLQSESGPVPGVGEREQITATGQSDLLDISPTSAAPQQQSQAGASPGPDPSADQDANGLFLVNTTPAALDRPPAFHPYIARYPRQAGMELRLVNTKDGLQLVLESKDPLAGSILADQSSVSAPPEGWWAWSAGNGSWVPGEEKTTPKLHDPAEAILLRLQKAAQPSEEKPPVLRRLSPDDVE